jgi:hypothetical protein
LKETSDVYVLPPPEKVVTLSLGYRAAVADLLWAHVLVSQGLHMFQKRRYDNITRLIDTINELDPEFRDPYLAADALVNLQYGETSREEMYKVREIMERGTRNRPLDGEMWLVAGQFVAFIGPSSVITDPKEQEEWSMAGAAMLARASELGGDDSSIAWQALGGAAVLSRAGKREATIKFLERALAVTDDQELQDTIRGKLRVQIGERQAEQAQKRWADFSRLWKTDLPFVSKTMVLVLGPPFDPFYCAGGARQDEKRCASTWKQWFEIQDPARAH